MYVILDTEAIHRDFHLSNRATRELLETAAGRGLIVCIPEVVIREMVADFREETIKTRESLQRLRRDTNHLQLVSRSTVRAIDLDAEVEEYEKRFHAVLEQFQVRILGLPNIDVGKLIDRGISRRKPFKRNGQGLFDAVVWESVVELCRQEPYQQLAIITADKDYRDEDGDRIHPDLLVDLGAIRIEVQTKTTSEESDRVPPSGPPYVELHKSIQEFNADWTARLDSIMHDRNAT